MNGVENCRKPRLGDGEDVRTQLAELHALVLVHHVMVVQVRQALERVHLLCFFVGRLVVFRRGSSGRSTDRPNRDEESGGRGEPREEGKGRERGEVVKIK